MRLFLTFLLALSASGLSAQQAKISGKVISAEGEALENAVVVLDGTQKGALTNADGTYEIIELDHGPYKLMISFVGYKSVSKDINVNGDLTVDVRMEVSDEVDVQTLEAVDIQKKSEYYVDIIPIREVAVLSAAAAPMNGVFANQNVTQKEIAKLNNGQDMPQMLRFTPSIVTTSDAGAGIGYTGLRIRGTDQSRINVTINGIPYNDPESQGVFWVNLPDFATSADNINIQRGVGSSTNGAGAFGGTIGITTDRFNPQSHAIVSNTYGSFNTFRHSVSFGTGNLPNGFNLEGRLSQITSDGYVDRASSDLKSYYVGGQWNSGRVNIKGLVFGGKEVTYQSWWGVPEVALEGTDEEIETWGINNGYSERQINDLQQLGRRANYYTYENEVDNYAQDHYQLHTSFQLMNNLTLKVSGHYTYGRGYFEQFREGDDFADYGLDNIVFDAGQQFTDDTDADGNPINLDFEGNYDWDEVEIEHEAVTDENGDVVTDPNGNTLVNSVAQITQTDLIRRRWLENDFYGGVYSLNYDRYLGGGNRLSVLLGGGYNEYDGDHFGELTWMEHSNGTDIRDLYYLNNGFKTDFHNYLKANYFLDGRFNVYGDVQFRQVSYRIEGIDENRQELDITDEMSFLNPKVGISAFINRQNSIYASFAVANREPSRADYVDAPNGEMPRPESMNDLEFGYRRVMRNYNFSMNFYNMDYTDQLVLTGAINDVGTPIRTNVASSYRRGVELEFGYRPVEKLSVALNGTFSQNKIQNFTEVVPAYDEFFSPVASVENDLGETDIAFSPNMIAAGQISYTLFENRRHRTEIGWMTKYVGEQFLDNTSNTDRMIDAYLVNDLRLSYSLFGNRIQELNVNLLVNNVLDELFVSNGYTYSYFFAQDRISEDFFYPQAGRNILLGLTLRF